MLFTLSLATIVASSAQTFTTLVKFHAGDGGYIYAALVQGADGYFYGAGIGSKGGGYPASIFRMAADGALTILGTLGQAYPDAGLVQDTDGNLYGTTVRSGKQSCGTCGTIYQVSPDGSLKYIFSLQWDQRRLSHWRSC
jgi:uncharacterized repeat protein (TIGR03803 family)